MSRRSTVLFALLLAGYSGTMAYWLRKPLASDFTKFYAAAEQVTAGLSPYQSLDASRFDSQTAAEAGPLSIHPSLNPPFLTLLLLPLSWLPLSVAAVLFALSSLAAGFMSMRLLISELGIPTTMQNLVGSWIILLAFFPTWATIRFNQLSLFLFLLIVIAWGNLRRDNQVAAGLSLGILMSLKLFTGLILLPLLLRRRLLSSAVAILTVGAAWSVSVLALGFGIVSEYRQALSQITWTGASWNASLLGFFSRIFGGSEGIALWHAPQAGRVVATVLAVLLTLVLVWTCLQRPRDRFHDDTCFLLSLPLMLLLSPLGWMYYFPMLLLPAALLWLRGKRFRSGLFLGLAALPVPFQEAGAINGYLDSFLLSGLHVYALLWLSAALVWETWCGPTSYRPIATR